MSRNRLEAILVLLLGVYYLARLLFFALSISPGVPPDESTHVGIAKLYSTSLFLIQDSPESHALGLVTRVPFLYHLLMGKLLLLNIFGLEPVLWLRLWNVLLSVLTVAAAYRLACRVAEDWTIRLLMLVMVTNTLMFTFLGASVSYDNLVNLLAVLAVDALLAFLRSNDERALLTLALFALLGSLTKLTFLPLSLALALLLVVHRRSSLVGDMGRLAARIRKRRPATLFLAIAVGLTLLANFWIYGANLVRYRKPVPSCEQVLSLESCKENRIFARNWIVKQYREGHTSFEQAFHSTRQIDHLGDREHTLRLLRNEQAYQRTRPEPLPVLDYMGLIWNRGMKPAIFGVQAHQSMLKTPWELLPYNLVLLAGFLLWVRGCALRGEHRTWFYLGALPLFYFIVLVGYFNYTSYLGTHASFLGVQGRYIFPVLVPAYLVIARFLLGPCRRKLRIAVLVIVAAIFIVGDFPYFLRNDGDAWFAERESVEAMDRMARTE